MAHCAHHRHICTAAIGNDYGYEEVFSRQVEGLGQSGDLLIESQPAVV